MKAKKLANRQPYTRPVQLTVTLEYTESEIDEVNRLLNQLRRSTLRLRAEDGSLATFSIIQSVEAKPRAFVITFTPGVGQALADAGQPIEMLRKAARHAS